jgi:hypothetical protein
MELTALVDLAGENSSVRIQSDAPKQAFQVIA